MFLCLTEIGAKPESVRYMQINGFNLSSYYCRSNFKAGGVGIWTRDNLNVTALDLNKYCQEKHFEMCATLIKTNVASPTIVLNCYRSPCGDLSIFFEGLTNVLNFLFKPTVRFILCGDFNVDGYYDSKEFVNLCGVLSSYNLKPIVRWPTRVTNSTITLIDNIFTNITGYGSCCVVDNTISDHRTILLQSNLFNTTGNSQFTSYYKRCFTDPAIALFNNELEKQNWAALYNLNNVDKAFSYFLDAFMILFDKCFPLTEKKRKRKSQDRNWINNEIKISSFKLNDLFILKREYPALADMYKGAKKDHVTLVRNAKKGYYQNKIFSSDNPSKSAWSVIADLSNNTKRQNNININHCGTQIVNEPNKVASLFNNYFKNAPLDVIKQIPRAANKQSNSFKINTQSASMYLSPISEEEILNILKHKIKSKWSAGPDEVPLIILKKSGYLILKPLVFLINLSFTTGCFPSNIKTSRVIPIYKKGNSQLLQNYRPVAISSAFSKILEYAFLNRLEQFLSKNNIITTNQHGFVSGKSTTSAIHSFYGKIMSHVENGECPVGVFCDLSRAFDCVSMIFFITSCI